METVGSIQSVIGLFPAWQAFNLLAPGLAKMALTQISLNGHGRSLALQAVGSDQEPPRDSRGESIMSAGNSKDGLLPRIKSHTIKKIIDRVTLLVVSFFMLLYILILILLWVAD